MATSHDVIRTAIRERRRLAFDYRGLQRVVEPMALGVGIKGHWQIRTQQVGGKSSSGSIGTGTPKLFDVAFINRPSLLDIIFMIPLTYQSNDKAFTQIDTELSDYVDASRVV